MRVSGRDGRAGQDVLRRVGEASVLILISLADGPKHGYALIQDIKELADVELGPGTLYGALDRLERLGLIESLPAEDRRHPYRITAPGAAALRVHLDSLERVSAAGRLRRRHGEEAAELAALLIRDGTPAGAVAWSYLAGAAREWLTPRPGRHLTAVACALLVAACSLGAVTGLLASAGPARAASTSRVSGPAPCRPVPA